MIVEGICNLFFGLLKLIIGILPTFNNPGTAPTNLISMLAIGKQFFPVDVVAFALGSILLWININLIFGAFKFVIHLGKH